MNGKGIIFILLVALIGQGCGIPVNPNHMRTCSNICEKENVRAFLSDTYECHCRIEGGNADDHPPHWRRRFE